MCPVCNPRNRLYGKAKTHKFGHPQDITKENVKFQQTDQTGTYTYSVAQVISNYMEHYTKMSIALMTLKSFQLYHLWKKMKRMFYIMWNLCLPTSQL